MVLGKNEARSLVTECVQGEMSYNDMIRLIINLYESFLNASLDADLLEHQLDLAENHITNKKNYS